jgi:tetratricopeptide (TPR) repeat protein
MSASTDPEAGMAIGIFYYLDYPVFPLFLDQNAILFATSIFISGGFLWFCYGALLQSLIFVRRPGNWLRLAICVLLVAFLWTIPEIRLALKPRWEADWDRAWAIGQGKGTNSDKAVKYVSDAIGCAPDDKLPMLWDYLGNLYLEQQNYPLAESAYKSLLALAQAQPSPNPKDLLHAYGALNTVYFRSGDIEARKECLHKIIDLSRIVNGGNSLQEANAWQSLATITHNSGDPRAAAEMLSRAITIYTALHDEVEPYDYLNRTVQKWKSE